MELILKETIDSLGREGDIVKVKPGYARNFLLPKGKAVPATAANMAILERNKTEIEARLADERKQAENLFKKLSGITLKFEELAGEDDKLFGSVSTGDINEKLTEKGIVVEKKHIILDEPIKTLGERRVTVKAGFDLEAVITIVVTSSTAESASK